MKKTVAFLIMITITVGVMISCKKSDIEVPDGLQIVKISESGGYQFFGPEGWIVANDGEICASYVSAINNTSITFAPAEMPEDSIPDYFAREKEKFSYKITVIEEKETTFGNAEYAYSFVYTFKYQERDFAALQIFVKNADDFYVFTYTSYGDPTAEDSEYQNYLEVVRLSIDSFTFTEKKEESASVDYPKDSDGYLMVSDPQLSGFELYVPSDCRVCSSSAEVTVMLSEKATVNVTKATSTGVSVVSYLETRKSELEGLFGEVTDISIRLATEPDLSGEKAETFKSFDVAPTADEGIVFGNLNKATIISYEYSYVYQGTVYRVYQILGVDSFNGYVLTYTAPEEEFDAHSQVLDNILKKVKF